MNKNKKIITICIAVLLMFVTLLTGCTVQMQGDGRSIVSITKTDTVGLVDTYTIVYSDGTKSTFTITNGSNGANGQDLDINAMYQKWLEENENGSYETFLKEVLNVNNADNSLVINKALCSSLKVYTEFTMTYTYTNKQSMNYINMGSGSAVVYKIDEDYTYIITNYHVVYNHEQNTTNKIATKITCYLYGSESVPVETDEKDENDYVIYDYGYGAIDCEFVGGSAIADIAVLKTETQNIKAINPNVKAVEFASEYHVGDTAIAIGNPDDDGISVTQGIISMDNELIDLAVDGVTRSYRSIRIDTPLYPGNSGGGLFNIYGKLIGITNAGNVKDQNVNYAVPVYIVKPVVENILLYKNGSVNKVTLGVTVQKGDSKYVYNEKTGYGKVISDINVVEVNAYSIAYKMGLKIGDKIIAFNLNSTQYDLDNYLAIGDVLYSVKVGDVISFNILRDGESMVSKEYMVNPSDISKIA
jgi:serine protease Do